MEWWRVLMIFAVAGCVGGSLATIRLLDLTNPSRRELPVGRPIFLYNAVGGVGGALALLFFMILDQKIKPNLGSQEILTYATTGFIAGFLGWPLLNLAAGSVLQTLRLAIEGLDKRVDSVARDFDQKVVDIRQHVNTAIRSEKERTEKQLTRMADTTALAWNSVGEPSAVAAGIAGAPVGAGEGVIGSKSERQARAALMSAIIRGRLAQDEEIAAPELSALIDELEQGLALFPDRRAAFIVLGQLYKKRGEYAKGIEVLKRGLAAMEESGAADPIDIADTHYNLACYSCLLYAAETDPQRRQALRSQVFDHLRPAIQLGPHRAQNLQEAATDPDFIALRDDAEFKSLLSPPDALAAPGQPPDPGSH